MELRRAVSDSALRVRAGAWSAAQCGLAAAGAWAFSTRVLDHQRPFFASVAAVVSLGLTAGGRLRRTAELSAGVALGVGVGDAWVGVFGQGIWQIGAVVFLALLAALAINGGGLAVTQAAVQSVFVVALPRTPHSGFHRWQDALVGGAVALMVAALLPSDPWKAVHRLRCSYLGELSEVVRGTAEGIRTGSSTLAADALGRGRMLEPVLARWRGALSTGRETSRITPFRETRREEWEALSRLLVGVDRGTGNVRVLMRRVVVALDTGDPLPSALPDLLEDFSDALALAASGGDGIPALVSLAAQLDPVTLGAQTLSAQVVVAQLRVAVVDLLGGLGHESPRDTLPTLTP